MLLDGADRCVENDALAQSVGELLRDLLRTADEALLLRSAADRDQAFEPLPRAQIVQEIEKRQIARLGGEDGAGHDVEKQPCPGRAHVAALPGLERHAVPVAGVGRFPGAFGRNLALELIESLAGPQQLQLRQERQSRQVAVVPLDIAVPREDFRPRVVLRKAFDAELCGQSGEQLLPRADPLTAQVDRVLAEPLAERAPADPIAHFEHDAVQSAGHQIAHRAQPRQPGADDDDVERIARCLRLLRLKTSHIEILAAKQR